MKLLAILAIVAILTLALASRYSSYSSTAGRRWMWRRTKRSLLSKLRDFTFLERRQLGNVWQGEIGSVSNKNQEAAKVDLMKSANAKNGSARTGYQGRVIRSAMGQNDVRKRTAIEIARSARKTS
jgi:hypothetical protein